MIEYLPYALCLFIIAYMAYKEEVHRIERRDLLRMIKARDLDEVVRAEKQDKKKDEPEEVVPPEFSPTESLTDDEFLDAVNGVKQDG